jgi:hypothetical protein
MIKTFFTRYNQITSILFGITVAWLTFYWGNYAYYKYRPVEMIYTASLRVPDYQMGTDPEVVYINNKKEEFKGTFVVEIKNTDELTVCRGKGGPFIYSEGEKASVTTLNDYIWIDPVTNVISKCAESLPPGYYYVETTFFINQEGRPERVYGPVRSNLFEVLRNEQPSIL